MTVLAPTTLRLDLNLKQGADATITLIDVRDANNQVITTTTGYSVRAQIRATPAGPVLFEWNTTPGAGIGTASFTYSATTLIATVKLTVTAAQSSLWTFTAASWDCLLTNPSSQVACLAEGTVTIDPLITR